MTVKCFVMLFHEMFFFPIYHASMIFLSISSIVPFSVPSNKCPAQNIASSIFFFFFCKTLNVFFAEIIYFESAKLCALRA